MIALWGFKSAMIAGTRVPLTKPDQFSCLAMAPFHRQVTDLYEWSIPRLKELERLREVIQEQTARTPLPYPAPGSQKV